MKTQKLLVLVLSTTTVILCGVLLALISSCAPQSSIISGAAPPCTSKATFTGAEIDCPGSQPVFLSNGVNGASCTVNSNPTEAFISCPDGSTSTIHDGSTGQTGASGTDAIPCTTSPIAGGVQITCPNGSTSTVLNGAAGTPGTVITPVQFCPSLGAPVYSGNFPEWGFCLGGDLYGVYFTGNYAFWTKLPPGAYSSTSMNGCNFTIGANCQVTEN